MITALLLDLDDTLIDDRGAMADAVVLFRREHKFCPHEDDASIATRWDAVGRALWRSMARGVVSVEDQRRRRLRATFGMDFSDREADSLFASYLTIYESCWRLMPGTETFLSKTAHLPRAVVTNGSRVQVKRKLERLNLSRSFQFVVTPDDCGARKPDARIFEHALSLFGVAPESVLMVGDNEEADILPALALGMKAFHVDSQRAGAAIEHAASAANHCVAELMGVREDIRARFVDRRSKRHQHRRWSKNA